MDTENKAASPEGNEEEKKADANNSPEDAGNKLLERINYLESEFKSVIKQRDELKKKFSKIETDEAVKRGEFEKVINEKSKELESLQTEIEQTKVYKEKFEKLENEIRIDLLSQLSEEHKKIAKMLPVETLREYVKINSSNKLSMDTGTNGRGSKDYSQVKDLTELTAAELEDMRKSQPNVYARLYKAKYPFAKIPNLQ